MDLTFDPLSRRYPSRRFPIYARGGMVNCSSPQASAAGLEVLRRGGNAADAAVAAAAALTVVEPTANGLGADAFALIWSEKEGKLAGINGSGPAPMRLSADRLRADGFGSDGVMPKHGWAPVTVPGAPRVWAELAGRYGRLGLKEDLAPAIAYAEEGWPCAPNLAQAWNAALRIYEKDLTGPCFDAWFRTFAPDGKAPAAGELVRLPDHAATLAAIAETDAEAFYTGAVARKIDEESRRYGGYLRYDDLAAYRAEWVEPISVDYRGFRVCEIPPNGQGIVALIALNILKEFSFAEKESAETLHRQIEAVKMAFADAFRTVTDPRDMEAGWQSLLDPAYGARRASEMGREAKAWTDAVPPKSGTVYLCCADGEGNMVSFIQSNYMGFGSGIVVGGTGVALQNRGADFSLDPRAVNFLKPGKKTYHTIIPGFLMKDGVPVGPFGVMGGYMQPQGHVQVLMNLLDFHLDPQQALDAPRWQWLRDGRVAVEAGFDGDLARELAERGHEVFVERSEASFGRGQMILRADGGVLVGGTESRTDSNIACF